MTNFPKLLMGVLLALVVSCSPAPDIEVGYDPGNLRFDGDKALETVTEFSTQFPYRTSGMPNNKLAADWLQHKLEGYGLSCVWDEWEIINYSEPLPLNNVVCHLPGQSEEEIVVVAHHDQSPDTIYGADNDGSGIAILLQLAEIFSSEDEPKYTLTFLVADGEEWGMVGTNRFVETHPNPNKIVAGISLDNLGKEFYYNLEMSPIGQFSGYGPLWIQLMVQSSASAAGDLWIPPIRLPLDQVLNQAVPISFMDQGPLVAAGVPAIGFAGLVPPENREDHWNSYHAPGDVVELQSASVLYQSGRIPEALIRELLHRETLPVETGPYLYLERSDSVVRGWLLYAVFIGFTALFFLAAYQKAGRNFMELSTAIKTVWPHWLSLWLPLIGGVLLTYLLVAMGIMDKYDTYPATAKNYPLFNPRWEAVGLFVLGVGLMFTEARRRYIRFQSHTNPFAPAQVNSFALVIIGLSAVYMLLVNPFSLLFLVPVTFWILIKGQRSNNRWVDVLLFLLGWLVIYALIYFFGFIVLRNGFAVLWYLLMMFSIRMIGFPAAIAITAIVASGLSMIVSPIRKVAK